jgi:hypothetical protein
VAEATPIELLAAPPPGGGGTLYRALRDDVPFRFVAVGRAAGAPRYDVVHEDGVADGAGGVVLIDPFDVPVEADDAFLADWHAERDALAARPGYQGTRLYRAATSAEFRFVAFARWSSPLAFARAIGGATVPHAALYLLVPG